MNTTTTGGREYGIERLCPYCQVNTGGWHQPSCPNYRVIRYDWPSAQLVIDSAADGISPTEQARYSDPKSVPEPQTYTGRTACG